MHDGCAPLVVPELLCPTAPAVSPYAARLDLDAADWAGVNGLCPDPERARRLSEARLGTLAARTCPDADLERLTLYTRWWTFGFFWAEEFFGGPDGGHRWGLPARLVGGNGPAADRRRAAADAAMATVSARVPGGMRSGRPLTGAVRRAHRLDLLDDLLSGTARWARCEQLSRFGTAINLCLSRHARRPPAPEDPEPVPPFVVLAEIVTGCPAEGPALAAEDVQRLTLLARQRAAWCERLHSAARHGCYADLVASLPAAMRLNADAHPQRALDRAARVHDEAARAYLRLAGSVAAGADPALRAYLDLLSRWLRGHHDWCRDTLPLPPTAEDVPGAGPLPPADPPAGPRTGVPVPRGC